MIVEYIKNAYEEVKDRLKNPFLDSNKTPFAGAFIIALLIYNWELIFTILTFDYFETRSSKITIIKEYIASETWYKRLLCTLGIAFASIIFFYIFNYLSLGITTFFRRWFKGIILYFTDKSQIVPLDELERNNKRYNIIKKNYDELKKSFSNVEDERNELSNQLSNLTSEFAELTNENNQLRNTIQESENKLKENDSMAKILFAQYGAEREFIDVTDIVTNLLAKSNQFTVDNRTMGVDPIKFSVKTLLIIYSIGTKVEKFTAIEEQEIELKNNKLHSKPTDKSKLKETYLSNEKYISDIFNGEWTLTSIKSGKGVNEKVQVDNTGRYFSNYKHKFFLKSIQIDQSNGKIKFNKVNTQRTLHSKEDLTIVDNNFIKGVDSLGFTIEYRRSS
jgi:hypothetical protein